jgi:hypothetical protein
MVDLSLETENPMHLRMVGRFSDTRHYIIAPQKGRFWSWQGILGSRKLKDSTVILRFLKLPANALIVPQ